MRVKSDKIRTIHAQWDREAEDLRKQYPNFNLQAALENPEVAQMMRMGASLTNAYREAYADRLPKRVKREDEARAYVRATVPAEEVLAQGAEEAAELGQALLKMRRVMDPYQMNPTPVKRSAALDHIVEEWADVLLCMGIFFEKMEMDPAERIAEIQKEKTIRWAQRLKE